MSAAPEPDAAQARTPSERAAAGRAARGPAPRSSHGEWEPSPDRKDPVKILLDQARGRVADLLPYRYGRMLESPLAFYRGAAAIMAADLAGTPTSGLRTQLCGDAHLANFGTFASPERTQVFDINDFDETLPGPWEWDLKRLAVSVCIAGRGHDFPAKDVKTAVLETVASYRESMLRFARQGNLEVWYAALDVRGTTQLATDGADFRGMRALQRQLTSKHLETSVLEFEKLTKTVDGVARFHDKPPKVVPIETLAAPAERATAETNARALLSAYEAGLPPSTRTLLEGYDYVGLAQIVPGVGSVGMRIWALLLHGRDGQDPLLLQAKEACPSVLEAHLGPSAAASPGRAGRRRAAAHAGGQRHLPRLPHRARARWGRARTQARVLRAPARRPQGLDRRRQA